MSNGTQERRTHHPDTATTMGNLGMVFLNQMDLATAEDLLVRALEIKTGLQGWNPGDVAVTQFCLAQLRTYQGRTDEALTLLESAFEVMQRTFGDEDFRTRLVADAIAMHARHRDSKNL
jgi:hypothetical protein